MKIRYYTYPPVQYPYILRNVKQKPLPQTKHEIVDIGVYELLKEPYDYSPETLQSFVDCQPNGWKVVPDYPDIFKEHSMESDIDNVVMSKALMKKYYDVHDPCHMPVIQGYFNDPHSFVDYSEWFKSKFLDAPEVIGVGTVCKLSEKETMLRTLYYARREFPDAWIHAFGLSIKYLDLLRGTINSFDSTAFTFPRTSGRPSAKNKQMRIDYFYEYLALVKKRTVDYKDIREDFD